MKEIFSAFGSEVFRPLATIVITGAMADHRVSNPSTLWNSFTTVCFLSLERDESGPSVFMAHVSSAHR